MLKRYHENKKTYYFLNNGGYIDINPFRIAGDVANTDLLHCGTDYKVYCPDSIYDFNQSTIEYIIRKGYIPTNQNRACGASAINSFIDMVRAKD